MKGSEFFKQVKEMSNPTEVSVIKNAFLETYKDDDGIDYERLGSDIAKCVMDPVQGFSNMAVSIPSILSAIGSIQKVSQAVKSPTVSILLGALKGAEIPEKFGIFLSSFLNRK